MVDPPRLCAVDGLGDGRKGGTDGPAADGSNLERTFAWMVETFLTVLRCSPNLLP